MAGAILVGVDGSLASRAAVEWALERAGTIGADVALLLVVDDEWGSIGERDLAELRASAERTARRELAFAREQAGAVPVSTGITVGAPMLELAVEAARAGVVAIGTHKAGSFHGYALGNRGLQLAAMSPVPVAIVPSGGGRGRSGVAVGIGDAPGRLGPVVYAADEAVRLGEELIVVRGGATGMGFDEADLRSMIRSGAASDLAVTVRRTTTNAGEALAAVSRRAVVTVTGRPTPPGARGFRPLGRTNNDLLMNAGGPVIVVPHESADRYQMRTRGPAPAVTKEAS